ncbi:Diacetyl reductase [(S)-acetoin forming] [Acinetobacter baumannii]|uniref:SDR family NAD(P)-dependent oxidoreductase n=1 Tax=Acinetobacter baumannii TaxID=470 RepID=UPI0009C44500|nr:SDR family NAD(P)-dependent oxidoreductase [Acinetobacter baumannii]SMB68329.1 Diacetyl reductase [(S)-acetoin forming] [Acinetobacter baumannii]
MILFGKKKVRPSQKAYAVVTGAGSGIGRSFAVELAKRGGSVVCADINLEAAEETVTLLEQQGAKAFAWGVIHGCHAFVPKFKKLGYGAIINVASAASYTAAPEMTAYNVTKAGVRALSETLSAELRKFNIKVNVLCPTLVPTNIIKNGRIPGRYSKLADHALMNYALTTSDDVAKLTLNRLDQDELYTIPQIDAKLFWLMKRASPSLYTKFLGTSYKLFK